MTLRYHINKLIDFHLKNKKPELTTTDSNRAEHNHQQETFFDSISDWFASEESVPAEVSPRLRQIIRAGYPASQNAVPEFLDVGCGAGVLFKPMRQLYPNCHITGVDLSIRQLQTAQSRYKDCDFWHGDILDYTPDNNHQFDAVWCNACFGNFYNQQSVVGHISDLLKPGGRLLITHPLGFDFVKALHERDPKKVPHILPDSQQAASQLAEHCDLQIESLLMEPELYILVYHKP